MKIKPILFSTDMVEAILAGAKTQTRRVIKVKPSIVEVVKIGFSAFTNDDQFEVMGKDETGLYGGSLFDLPFATGDVMWVRETWQDTNFLNVNKSDFAYIYKASKNGTEWALNTPNWKWRPSIFMPKIACRIFLKVTNVRIQRLHEISEDDAKAEGITTLFPSDSPHYNPNHFTNYTWHGRGGDDSFTGYSNTETAKDSFQSLWYQINGLASWQLNPYVFVYDFEIVERPIGFLD